MLYVTTRGNHDAFTVHRTLCSDRAPDGGAYCPLVMPVMDKDQIRDLKNMTFGDTVAVILNRFFSLHLTGWDIETAVGRNSINIIGMSHRIAVAELWRNIDGKFSSVVDSLYQMICGGKNANSKPTDWAVIAIRIAYIFGVYGELLRNDLINESDVFDICVAADDFTTVMASVYSRDMGLPMGDIICTSDSTSSVWDLIQKGIYSVSASDSIRMLGIERLIHNKLGYNYVAAFVDTSEKKRTYTVDEELILQLNDGITCVVADSNRSSGMINSVYRSNNYILDPATAVCYAGLQDHRAKKSSGRIALLLAETTPREYLQEISAATSVSSEKLLLHMK